MGHPTDHPYCGIRSGQQTDFCLCKDRSSSISREEKACPSVEFPIAGSHSGWRGQQKKDFQQDNLLKF
ncbi:unnamed protein product [Victoria cruziana]